MKKLDKDLLSASCQWLEQNGVISADDTVLINDIRRHKNEIAHELPHLLSDIDHDTNLEYLQHTRRLLRKIEIWWIRNVDMSIDPEFDNVEVADKDIHPGPALVPDEILRIALDNEDDE